MGHDGRDEQEAYRAQVIGELERRLARLREIDSAVAAVEFRLGAMADSLRPSFGDTARLLAGVALQKKLRRDRESLLKKRLEAAEDVARAQERLGQVDAELGESVEGEGS